MTIGAIPAAFVPGPILAAVLAPVLAPVLAFCAALAASLPLDAAVRPRYARRAGWRWAGWGRSRWGRAVQLAATATAFGLFLMLSGSAGLAAALAIAAQAVLVVASNAKHAVLGEPLLFSDFALVGALVRHPRFYLGALSVRQKAAAVAGAAGLAAAVAWLFVARPGPHLAGAALALAAAGLLRATLRGRAASALALLPDAEADVARHGLIPTILLYRRRWRAEPDPPACPAGVAAGSGAAERAPDLILIVQCESFADPVALTGDAALALPGLARARSRATLWGDLAVSGFGAYTMRTEYGVLFGRDEAALGFRRYDPFLTARGEASWALPARLAAAGYAATFAHPHDLRFYRRDRLMPAIGFARTIGAGGFPPAPAGARYLDDPTFGAALADLADAATGPTLLYAVTMENHGPWTRDLPAGSPGGLDAWLAHLRGGDAMLAALIDRLDAAGRPALLVFFGDHRPSIPGAVVPGPVRHTPYAMLRFPHDAGAPGERTDLSPAGLHHAILHAAGLQAGGA